MAAAGLPAGFHEAAAEIFDRAARADAARADAAAARAQVATGSRDADSALDTVMSALV